MIKVIKVGDTNDDKGYIMRINKIRKPSINPFNELNLEFALESLYKFRYYYWRTIFLNLPLINLLLVVYVIFKK